ncbi:enhancer of mRNA-decapping protein 3 [Aricia agestis]|uniref:enhancer of mRNA-decapping protein 3 n=1 Tax=Aricia agestis TaxID=91739 RepID=UPI001C204251|nr:enhancer of mRNA-decapping protein 3 [Aricia agestis]XP_041984499.1 enhancer of mRNA-decapping protein 3 [Aricia agestis]
MSKWVGFAVSVNCGEPLGCYQGTIMEADGNTITLTKAFRNGFPYPKSQVTLNASDIKDLKIIEEATEQSSEKTHSTVSITKTSKKAQKATVCENLQAIPAETGNQQNANNTQHKGSGARSAASGPPRSKPIDIQGTRHNKNNNLSGSFGNPSCSTPKGQRGGGGTGGGGAGAGGGGRDRAHRRNEACFGDAADPALADDFDFEGNLALFDKRALWERMRGRPDVVRAADDAARYRHDENVLGAAPAPAAIALRDELRVGSYSTDDGATVPAAADRLRRDLWRALHHHRLADSALLLLARAAADLALRLAGGGRRLEPRNAHQTPVAVAAVGAHSLGACGVAAARLLASHGVHAHVLLAGGPAGGAGNAALRRELAAFALAGGVVHACAERLPVPDVVVLALHEPAGGAEDGGAERGAALGWARGARGAVLALEPPAGGWGVELRASLVAGLPPAPAGLGRVFLANVAPPPALLRELGVEYRSPFGATSVLPLN